MAYEIRPWKKSDCALRIQATRLSGREKHSREINEAFGEGGALNANYQMVEAVARLTNTLGKSGFVYGVDFVWKTSDDATIALDFSDPKTKRRAEEALRSLI